MSASCAGGCECGMRVCGCAGARVDGRALFPFISGLGRILEEAGGRGLWFVVCGLGLNGSSSWGEKGRKLGHPYDRRVKGQKSHDLMEFTSVPCDAQFEPCRAVCKLPRKIFGTVPVNLTPHHSDDERIKRRQPRREGSPSCTALRYEGVGVYPCRRMQYTYNTGTRQFGR